MGGRRTRSETKKPARASGRLSSRGAGWFGAAGPRTSGLAPDPPWPLPARLAEPGFEARFVTDARWSMGPSPQGSSRFCVIRFGFVISANWALLVAPRLGEPGAPG